MSKRIVIALGGNALGNTAAEQLQLVTETAKSIVDLIAAGNEVVVAHGNGPQVGMINLGLSTAAEAKAIKADMPFPECGAMSEGYIGYHLQQAIGNELIALLKETAVAGYVAVVDLTRAGNLVRNNTFDAINPLMVVALTYLIMVIGLTQLQKLIERRLSKSDKR